jgi:hypothetical protein
MPSMSGWALRRYSLRISWTRACEFLCPRCRAGLCDSGNARPPRGCWRCFYALDVGLGFATRSPMVTSLLETRFLCPRCRAGLCDGCAMRVVVTCSFAHRCADRQANVVAEGCNLPGICGDGPLTSAFSPRQPRCYWLVRAQCCTGSRDDPEGLAFFDNPGTTPAGRAAGQGRISTPAEELCTCTTGRDQGSPAANRSRATALTSLEARIASTTEVSSATARSTSS